VYLSQYFQTARGMSPTEAGLMSIAMVGGLFLSSVVSGRIISDTGRWKRFLVGGMVLVVIGLALLGTIDETTNLVVIGAFMAILGVGLGATMQNLVLSVQNNVTMSDMGAASSVVAFFRTMGGSIGVSVLGALLSHQVAQHVTEGYAAAQRPPTFSADSHAVPEVASLPGWEQSIWEHAFGSSFGHIFLVATPFALIALACVVLIREVPLRTSNLEAEAVASPEVAAELHRAVVRSEA
jgi:MFS family permease